MTLKRDAKSGAFKDRIRLPEDVRLDYQALHGPAWEEKFHRPADTPPDKAVAEHAAWAAKIKHRIAALRDSKGGKGVDLTQREAAALAGDWYRWFTSQHLDNPGHAERWSTLREIAWEMASLTGDQETGEADFNDPEVLSAIDIEARTGQFVTDRGIALTQAGRALFLASVVRQFLAATKLLERRARDDWGPDQHLDQLAPSPTLSPATAPLPNGQRSTAVTGQIRRPQLPSAVVLFEEYGKAKGLSPRTLIQRRGAFIALDKENWRAPEWDAQQWLDALGADSRSPQTVRKNWLGPVRAMFNWATRRRLVEVNPFKDCGVDVPRRGRTRGRDFTEAEIQIILRASVALGCPMDLPDAMRRWVPWLLAYTGARVGEIAQLRVQDIEQRACGPVLFITPDAGPVKTGTARAVPIHPHLVEMGLLEYVKVVETRLGPQGRLFCRPRGPQGRPSKTPNGRGPPADGACASLGKWVRSLGITDVQPNHGWRHTFKTRAARAKIEERLRDEICGHTPRTEAGKYEHPTVEDMAEALKRFPRYELE